MYLGLKLIHILAVVMFIGNVVTRVFWHRHALATGGPLLGLALVVLKPAP